MVFYCYSYDFFPKKVNTQGKGYTVGASLSGHRGWILQQTGVDVLTGQDTRLSSIAATKNIFHQLLNISIPILLLIHIENYTKWQKPFFHIKSGCIHVFSCWRKKENLNWTELNLYIFCSCFAIYEFFYAFGIIPCFWLTHNRGQTATNLNSNIW